MTNNDMIDEIVFWTAVAIAIAGISLAGVAIVKGLFH